MKYTINQKVQTATGYRFMVIANGDVNYLPITEDDFNRFNVGDEFELMLIPVVKEEVVGA